MRPRAGSFRVASTVCLVGLVSVAAVSLAGGSAVDAATPAATTVPRSTPTTTTPRATTTVPSTASTTTQPAGATTTTGRTTTTPPATTPSTHVVHNPTTTTTTPAPPAPLAAPGVELVSQPPWIPTQGAEILALHLDQPGVADQPGASVQLTIHHSVTSRTDFDRAATGAAFPSTRSHLTFPFSAIHLNANHDFVVAFGLSGSAVPRSVGIASPGVYPVEVGLVGTTAAHSTFVTWMVVVDPEQARSSQRLRVSWIWQLDARPYERPHGVNASTLAAMRPGARLDRIATLLARAGSFPLTLGIGPETLSTWSNASRANPTFTPGFQRVRKAATRASTQLLPEPYVPIQGPTIEAEGLGAQLAAEYVAGSGAINDATDQIPDPRTVFVDPVDAATVGQLTQMFASRFVVRDSALAPVVEPLTPAQPFQLATGNGPPVPTAASDSGLEMLFGSPGPAALREQRVVAALAEIAYEAPSQTRGVVISTPDDWAPDVQTVTLLLHDLAHDPLVEPATLDMLFAEVPPVESNGAPLQRRLAPISAHPAKPLQAAEYNDAVKELAAYQAMVGRGDPSITAGQRALLLSLSTANTRSDALAYLDTITANLDALTSGITTTAKTLTLTARRADLPLSFQNNTGRANIHVLVHLDSQKLIFPKGADFQLTLPLGHTTAKRNEFPVEARASGTFAMTITLESPDGSVVIGSPTRVTIRSAVFSGIGIALTLGALLFLAFWWGNHFWRTRRARRRARAA